MVQIISLSINGLSIVIDSLASDQSIEYFESQQSKTHLYNQFNDCIFRPCSRIWCKFCPFIFRYLFRFHHILSRIDLASAEGLLGCEVHARQCRSLSIQAADRWSFSQGAAVIDAAFDEMPAHIVGIFRSDGPICARGCRTLRVLTFWYEMDSTAAIGVAGNDDKEYDLLHRRSEIKRWSGSYWRPVLKGQWYVCGLWIRIFSQICLRKAELASGILPKGFGVLEHSYLYLADASPDNISLEFINKWKLQLL